MAVERPGELNRDAGPDFFNAKIWIGDLLWAGNVEIHIKSSDWNLHGHSTDKAYNNVILHVVYIHDCDIRLENGKSVPTVAIADAIPQHVWDNYDSLMNCPGQLRIACSSRLGEIPDFLFTLSQERLSVERMESKTDNVHRIMRATKGCWEQACYWLTAHYFGGTTNAFPFELLAKITPMGIVAKIKDNPFRVEALYFGQAGLLQSDFADQYPKELKREYDYLAMAYKLRPMEPHLWRFFRLRPSSFPTLRISQFARLMASSAGQFSKLLDATDIDSLRELFKTDCSDYWLTHYTFDNESPVRVKSLGRSVVDSLLINAWIPLLFEYGKEHADNNLKERSFMLLKQLPPEKNHIVRYWQEAGVKVSNAAESQALIHRYNNYCESRRCLDCQLAFRLINCKK